MKNKIQCEECKEYFKRITWKHLKNCCNLTLKEYIEKYSNIYFSGKNHPGYGKKRSKKQKEKMGESHKGQIPWNKGLKNCYSEETLNKMGKSQKNRFKVENPWNKGKTDVYSEKTLQQMSDSQKERLKDKTNNPFYNKKHTNEWKMERRVSRLKEIEQKYGIACPNYNLKACEVFDWFNQEFNLNGVHALNGGEYHIKELGYFLDYYEPELNLVIEWDEHHHFDYNNNLKEKDKIREKEIIKYLGCKFIRIKE